MDFWNKVKGFMPILSAVCVAVCVGMSLGGYEAPAYVVEYPEIATTVTNSDADEADQSEEVEETEATVVLLGSFDLEDGVYEGSGVGYGGTTKVAVTIADHTITDIEILSNQDDTAFFNRALTVVDSIIAGQTLDVDTVSGATYSSRGIINAVKNALTGEEDTSSVAETTTAAGSTSISDVEDAAAYADGTYYGTGTGFRGTIKVKVVISGGEITSIEIVSSSDDASYFNKAKTLISKIISGQTTNVDTVSGATYSSVGIIKAVRNALSQAATDGSTTEDDEDEEESTEVVAAVTGTIPYEDGIYFGSGDGYNDEIRVAVFIRNNTIMNILVIKTSDDDGFFDRAIALLDNIIIEQTVDVDTVTGATFSSEGLIEAVTNALKAAANGTSGSSSSSSGSSSSSTGTSSGSSSSGTSSGSDSSSSSDSTDTDADSTDDEDSSDDTTTTVYANGSYTVTVPCYPDEDEDFDQYNLTLTVTIKNDTIVAITNVSGDGDSGNDKYIEWAVSGRSSSTGVVTQILESGSVDGVDTVTRATCSSNSIIEAVKLALEYARN